MAIITPLKKIFNWQTASEKIPYKVYTAYITVDDSENMYASQVLQNTIGAVTFEKKSGNGYWIIKLPYLVPRLKIMIPGFGDYLYNNNGTTEISVNGSVLFFYPGFDIDDNGAAIANINTNCVGIQISQSMPWRTFFASGPTGPTTSYPIEIRVYN